MAVQFPKCPFCSGSQCLVHNPSASSKFGRNCQSSGLCILDRLSIVLLRSHFIQCSSWYLRQPSAAHPPSRVCRLISATARALQNFLALLWSRTLSWYICRMLFSRSSRLITTFSRACAPIPILGIIELTNAVRGSHDLAIALSTLGFLLVYKPLFRLARASYLL